MITRNKARLVDNLLISTFGKYAEYFLGLIASVFVARALGPSEYGVYAYIIFICGWLIQLSNISLPTTAIRFVAEFQGKGDEVTGRRVTHMLLRRQSVTAILVSAAFLIGIEFYRPEILDSVPYPVYLLMVAGIFCKARYMLLIAVAKGYERFDIEAITAILAGVVSTAAVIVLAFTTSSFTEFFGVYVMACVLMLVSAKTLCSRNDIRSESGPVAPLELERIHSYRRLTILLGLVALLGGFTIELFLLGQYGTTAQVGFLSVSVSLTRGLEQLLTVGLTMILMPSMARAFGEADLEGVRRIFLESTRFYIFFGAGLGFSCLLLARPVIQILYGAEFEEAIWVFSSLLFIAGIGLSNSSIGAFLSTTNRQDLRVKFSLIVVSVHILLALLLVPSYQLLGAVISGGVSSVFGVILGMQWIARNLGTPLQFGIYFRLLASGAIAFAIAYLINLSGRHFSIDVLSILAYAVIYVMLTIKLRCWKEQDLQLVYYVLDKLPSPISTTVEKAIERIRSRAKS